MASGNFAVASSNKYVSCVLNWESTAFNSKNYSNVYYELRASRTNSGYTTYGTGSGTVTVGGTPVSFNISSSQKITQNSNTLLASGTVKINHDDDGSKQITISVSASIPGAGLTLGPTSKTITLDKIPRHARILTATDFTDEENPSITFSKAGAGEISVWLEPNPVGTHLAIRENIENTGEYIWELTEEEREQLRNSCSEKSCKCRIGILTIIDDTEHSTYLDKTLSIVNAEPVIEEVIAEDTNEASLAVTWNNQTIVRGFSDVDVSMFATALKGATIKEYKIKNGITTIDAASGNFADVESGDFVFSVTDSRGFTTEQTLSLPLIEYVKLSCNMNEKPPDAEGNLLFTITGNCFAGSFGDIDNEPQVYLRLKENDGSFGNWIAIDTIVSMDNRYSAEVSMTGLNYQSRYTFQARVTDFLDEFVTQEKTVRTTPVCDWGEDDFNFNVPILLKNRNLIDVLFPVGTTYETMNKDFDPNIEWVGTWERIKGKVLVGVDEDDEKFNEAGKTGGQAELILRACIGATHEEASRLGYIAVGVTDYQSNHAPTYSVKGSSYTTGGTWNHSTPVVEYNKNSDRVDNMPPFITVYRWVRVE